MGFLDRFRRAPKRFVAPAAFETALRRQLALTPQTVAQLRELGATPQSALRLEFFFYTNTVDKAAALAQALAARDYDVRHGTSAADKALQIITGWSTPVLMADDVVAAWTEQMARLGLVHDCEFDGWGTNPQQ
jgi:regulator of RNase E activity RraB